MDADRAADPHGRKLAARRQPFDSAFTYVETISDLGEIEQPWEHGLTIGVRTRTVKPCRSVAV